MATGTVIEHELRVMGTDAHIVLCGPPTLLDHLEVLADLEARWSRFLPSSELSQCNARAGHPTLVSPNTFDCIARALDASRLTNGAFDPTVTVTELGYDRTFDELPADGPAVTGHPAPGAGAIRLDPTVGTVTVSPGTSLDLGGLAKGYAADLLCEELMRHGADGACINIGGDLRVAGHAPGADGWIIGVDPTDVPDLSALGGTVLALTTGAVATSTNQRRRWTRSGQHLHHIVDPRTGLPAHSGINIATVIADTAWRAEALATALMVTGADAIELVTAAGGTGFVVADTSEVIALPGLTEFLR